MKIIAVVPAFNEEKTIGGVLSALTQVNEIAEIVVVNDGSTDKTAQQAANYAVTVVTLGKNRGKGGAIKAGLERCQADVVLFLDADLIGLRAEHVRKLLEPVVTGEYVMSVGIFERGRKITDLAQKVAPYLSGQRAVRREVMDLINDLDICRFGLEMAVTRLAESYRYNVKEVQLLNLTHVTKEEKYGIIKGTAARLKMYWEIIRYCYWLDSSTPMRDQAKVE